MYELTIRRPSSLLSVVLSQEITPSQLSIIAALLKQDITYGEVLAFLASRKRQYPNQAFAEGVSDTWNDNRREGIEQFQAEDR